MFFARDLLLLIMYWHRWARRFCVFMSWCLTFGFRFAAGCNSDDAGEGLFGHAAWTHFPNICMHFNYVFACISLQRALI